MNASPTTSDERAAKARTLDFRRVSQFTRHQIRRLEHAHEQFCRLASIRMTSELGAELSLSVNGHDQLPYSVVMDEESPSDAIVAVISIDPAGTEIVMTIQRSLALSLVTHLLGGEPDRAAEDEEELTPIELAIARLVTDKLVETLSGAWGELGDVYLQLVRIEGSPTDVTVAPPSEPTLVVSLDAQIEGLTSQINLVMPYRAVKHVAQRSRDESYQTPDPDTGRNLRQHLSALEVEMRAEVACVQLPLADVLKFQPGQLVPLKAQADEGVALVLDHGPCYVARPARRGSTRVVQVLPAGSPRSVASRAAAHAIAEMHKDVPLGLRHSVLLELPVQARVELGRAVVTVGQAINLTGGEVLELDRSPDDPVGLYVDGFPYARGELVEVDGEWAVRLTDVRLRRELLDAQGIPAGRLASTDEPAS